jgi:divalent metal cation (Fe/Co/Zn/Cd) transporter
MNFSAKNLLLVVLGIIVGITISSLISFLSGLTVLTIAFYVMTIVVIIGLLEISRRLLFGVEQNQEKEAEKLESKEKVTKLETSKSAKKLVNDTHIEINSELKRLKRQTRIHNKNNNL